MTFSVADSTLPFSTYFWASPLPGPRCCCCLQCAWRPGIPVNCSCWTHFLSFRSANPALVKGDTTTNPSSGLPPPLPPWHSPHTRLRIVSWALEKSVLHRHWKNYSSVCFWMLIRNCWTPNSSGLWHQLGCQPALAKVLPFSLDSHPFWSAVFLCALNSPMILNFHPSAGLLPDLSGGSLRALFHCESTLPHPQPPHRWEHSFSAALSAVVFLWLPCAACRSCKALFPLEVKRFMQITSWFLPLPPTSWTWSLTNSPGSWSSLPTLPSLHPDD